MRRMDANGTIWTPDLQVSGFTLEFYSAETGFNRERSLVEGQCHLDTCLHDDRLSMALFTALQLYEDKRRTGIKMPQRNKFVSRHIFKQTGVRRRCKQVASRLVVLKNACNDPESLSFIFYFTSMPFIP